MKKIRLTLAAIAAILAVFSCNKNELNDAQTGRTRITIGAKPEEATENTKTYLSEEVTAAGTVYHSKWSNSGEQLGVIFGAIDDKSKPVTLSADDTTDNDPIFEGKADLEDGTYNMFVFYPRSAYEKCYAAGTGETEGTVGVNLKATQHPVCGSFDPSCDLMGWATNNATVNEGALILENITLFRPMAILRVNLNAPSGGGLATAKEVGSVTGFKMEVADGESAADKVTLTGRAGVSRLGGISKWTIENSYVEASMDASELITIGDDAGFQSLWLVVNATTIPAGRQITFSVETEGYNGVNKISRTVTVPTGGMQLEAGKINTINLTLRDKDFPASVIDEDYNGQWLMAGYRGGEMYAAVAYESGNNIKATAPLTFSADGSTITSTADLAESMFTFTKITEDGDYKGLYTIQDANNLYLYATSASNNYLKANAPATLTADYYWAVTKDGEAYSIVASKSSKRNVMQFNPNDKNANALISCYTSADLTDRANVILYPWSMVSGLITDPVITFEGAEPMTGSSSKMVTKTVSATATSVDFPYTKNRYVTELPTVRKYSFMGAWFVSDGAWEVTDNKVTFTLTPNTTPYTRDNQFIVLGQGFTDEARMYLLIKQEAYDAGAVTTISTILSDDTITSSNTVNYEVDGVTVMAAQGRNYVIGDATGVMLLYAPSGTTLTVGKQYKVSGGVKLFNGVHEYASDLTITESTGTAPAAGTPEAMTVSSLTAYTSAPVTKYAVVTATVQASGYLCSDGTNTINVYDGTGTWANFYNKSVKVTGYLIGFKSSGSQINMIATAIEDATNPNAATLSVNPAALNWAANEYGASSAQTVTVTLNSSADIDSYFVNGDDAGWQISNSDNIITVYPKAANTSSAAKTFTFQVVHADDSNVSQNVTVTQAGTAALTIADLLTGGTNTYTGVTDELLVYAVTGSNAIVGDSSGKMLLYMSGHGRSAGDIITITNPVIGSYQTVVPEITGGTIQTISSGNSVNHGTPVDLDVASVASSQQTAFSASGFHSAVFVKMTGAQSGRNITNDNTTLYLNQTNSTCDGKTVNTTGYIYAYNSSYKNFYYHLVTIEENSSVPTLSVDPTSLSWAATEYGTSTAKTITVTLNASATGYTVSGSSSDWTVSDNGSGTVTVYPKAANSSTTADKTLTLTFTHKDASSISKQVMIKQLKASSGGAVTSYTLDSSSIAAAHNTAWQYTSGSKTITAADGSKWIAYNTYANTGQVTVQMNTGKSAYVETPSVSGKITKVTVELTSKSDGSGTGTRALNILDGSGTAIASSVSASSLISGYSLSGSYSKIRFEAAEGATYIKSIKIDFE